MPFPRPIPFHDVERACVEEKLTIHSGHENPLRSSGASLKNQLLFWSKKHKHTRPKNLIMCSSSCSRSQRRLDVQAFSCSLIVMHPAKRCILEESVLLSQVAVAAIK